MLSIGQFFKRIQNKHSKEVFVRIVVVEAIQKHAGVQISTEAVTFSSDQITLKNISPVARSQIFIKKQAILTEIMTQQEIKNLTNIR